MRNRGSVFLAAVVCIAVVYIIFLGLNFSAGQLFSPFRPVPTRPSGPSVDPVFREFYQTLGGQTVLGQPLTVRLDQDGKSCQYTDAVLMCYNPAEVDIVRRFSLEGLGNRLGVRESNPFSSPQMGSRDLGNGFVLYEEFAPLYDRIFGGLYAGRPLTQVRVNQANQRYEQFFENVGFYRGFDEPPGSVHLLSYGAYLCGPGCSKNLNEYWGIIQTSLVAQPFELSVSRLGWFDLGAPLSQPRLTPDGEIEQVYDNVVLYAPHDDLSQVRFRPIVLWLKLAPEDRLVARNQHEQLVFYEVEAGLGHNVPLFFDQFIANHGGRDLAGKPLTEVFVHQMERVFRQCFESYCLDYDLNAPQDLRVRMAPLGLEYIRQSDPAQVLRQAFSSDTVLLQVEEEQSQLGKDEQQRIRLHVHRRADGKPMYLVEGTLTVSMPGKPAVIYHIKPTDQNGLSEQVLEPIMDLPAMSVIEYQICLNLPSEVPICQTDSFLYRGE